MLDLYHWIYTVTLLIGPAVTSSQPGIESLKCMQRLSFRRFIQCKEDYTCQVVSAFANTMTDTLPLSTTLSMASPRNQTTGSNSSSKGETVLVLWLGLAASAIIALIAVLSYYLNKKSVEPGTTLESMELEHGGMYVFHFNQGSFYSQGTVPTVRSNLSDCLQQDTDMTLDQQKMTSEQSMTALIPQSHHLKTCKDIGDMHTDKCLRDGRQEFCGNKVSISGNCSIINSSEGDLCSPGKEILPKCQAQVRTFKLDLTRLHSEGEPLTLSDASPTQDDTFSEFLQPNENFYSHEYLINSNDR